MLLKESLWVDPWDRNKLLSLESTPSTATGSAKRPAMLPSYKGSLVRRAKSTASLKPHFLLCDLPFRVRVRVGIEWLGAEKGVQMCMFPPEMFSNCCFLLSFCIPNSWASAAEAVNEGKDFVTFKIPPAYNSMIAKQLLTTKVTLSEITVCCTECLARLPVYL